ncbi:MAG: heavy metal translocating P-type ATPase, partial [Spirochaetes bacterium]
MVFKTEKENMSTVVFDLKGMTCASCAMTVEKSLKKIPGVKEASVNIATELATAVIDPNVVSEREMAKAVADAGYELIISHEKKEAEKDTYTEKVKEAKLRMIWAWLITGPLALLMILDMTAVVKVPYFNLINILVSFPVIFIVGYPVIRSAFVALIHRGTNMDVLIMLGVTASFVTGILALFGMNIADYSAVGAMIMGFNLIGNYLETSAKGKASEAIKKLLKMSAKTARILDKDGKETEIAVEDLAVGDTMLVKPSEKIPTDGVILEGDTTIDESMATGESMPIRRTIGDKVIGATVNQMGFLKVRVTNVGDDTFIAQVVNLVEEAQGTKVPIQTLADKVVGIFVPAVLFIAAGVFLFWLLDPATGHRIMLMASSFLPWVNPDLGIVS